MVKDARISLLEANTEIGANDTLVLDNGLSFQLEEELGRGGSCIAYLAISLDGPKKGQPQVVKEFFPLGKDVSGVKRNGSIIDVPAEQASAFGKRMRHFKEGIASLNMFWGKDGGVHADSADFSEANGTFYSVSNVAGKHFLKDEPPTDMNVIAQIMISVCTALNQLHENKSAAGEPEPLVYLDCKPSNMFWTDVDDERWHLVRLFDFDTQTSLNSLKTGDDVFVSGSEGWIAPEQAYLLDECHADIQAMGRSLISEAADTYAVGAVFFWLIYGRPPKLEDDTASDVSLIAHDRIGLVRRHPSRRYFPRRFDSDRVKRKTAAILAEALCMEPVDRCSMAQLVKDFGELLEITDHNRATIAHVDARIDRLERYLSEQDARKSAEAHIPKEGRGTHANAFSYDMFENCAMSWPELSEAGRAISYAEDTTKALAIAKECGITEPDGRLRLLCKDMILKNGEIATVRIVGVSHDLMPSGKRAGITFGFVSPIGFQCMNEKQTNKGGWEQSDLRKALSSRYLEDVLPEEVVKNIQPVVKLTNNKGKTKKAGCVTETTDRLWLFSRIELAGEWNAKAVWIESPDAPLYDKIADGEGARYRLFTQLGVDDPYGLKSPDLSHQAPIVVRDSPGSMKYWLRSPDPDNSSDFGVVLELGQIANGYSSTGRYGVVPGFCF